MPIEAYIERLALKVETTAGTAIALSASDVIRCTEIDFNANLEIEERGYTDDQFTKYPGVVVGKIGSVNFTVDLAGKGGGTAGSAGGPVWADAFLACGMTGVAGSFAMGTDATANKTLTIAAYHEGNIRKLAGCMGTWKMNCGAKKKGQVQFSFNGIWQPAAATSLLTAQTPVIAPVGVASFTWNSVSRVISEFTVDAGVSVTGLLDAAQAAGYYRYWLDGRNPTANLDPEMITGTATWDDYYAGTDRALSCVVGTAANNIMTIAAGNAQIRSLVDGKRNGVRIHNMGTALTGASPVTIAFT